MQDFQNYDIIKLGFWPGGDRDGNPFVTAKITEQVADELRITLMKCYYNEFKALRRKLTFKGLLAPILELNEGLYRAMFQKNFLLTYPEIIGKLEEIKEILVNDYHSLYLKELNALINKVHIFKTHFAVLDIRQDHSKHYAAVEDILKQNRSIKTSLAVSYTHLTLPTIYSV